MIKVQPPTFNNKKKKIFVEGEATKMLPLNFKCINKQRVLASEADYKRIKNRGNSSKNRSQPENKLLDTFQQHREDVFLTMICLS